MASNQPVPVPVQGNGYDEFDPQIPLTELGIRPQSVNFASQRANGNPPAIDGALMAETSARAAALGMKHGEVVELIRHIEANAINTTMVGLPRILKDIQSIHVADLQSIMQDINALTVVRIPPTGLMGRFTSQDVLNALPPYVNLNDVLNIIARYVHRIAPAA